MKNFGKLITAMVTPFDENLKVCEKRLEKLVHHLIKDSDAIVVCGTTGEVPNLSKKEKLFLFKKVKEFAGNEVKIIGNVGTNNTYESVEFAKSAEKLGVLDGVMIVNPYYNKPSQEGLYLHYKTIAESITLPVMLYNIPSRTGVNLQSDTTIKLSKIDNIVAIKESSGDLSQMSRIIEGTDDNFSLYSGDDNLTLPILSIGGKGVVSVASHIFGKEIKNMIKNKNASTHRKLLPFFEGIFFTANPIPIKNILKLIKIETGSVRLPLVDLNKEEIKKYKQLYKETIQNLK